MNRPATDFQDPVHSPVQDPVHSPVQDPVHSPVQDPVHSPVQDPVHSPVQDPVHSRLLPADHVLCSGSVWFPGAFDRRGFPLVVFPAGGHDSLTSLPKAQVVYFIQYFLHLHRKQQQDSLVSVVADLSRAAPPSVSFIMETLLLLQLHQRTVHSVYFIQPKKKDVNKLLLKLLAPSRCPPPSFKKVLLKETPELSNHIDRSQLPACLGGYLMYCHQSWVAFVKDVDVFVQELQWVVQRLPSCFSALQRLSRPPASPDRLHDFCSVNEAQFRQLRRELRLDELLRRCRGLVEKLRHPDTDPCYQDMAGTPLFTSTASDMLQHHSRITAAVEKVELLWQQSFSGARLQLQLLRLRDEALQTTEKIQTFLQEKLQPYRVHISKDTAQAAMLATDFEASIHSPAMALVRSAEEVIHTVADILPPDPPDKDSWLLDLERLEDRLHSAVHYTLQTLRAVASHHQHYDKANRWYSLVLHQSFLQELLSGVQGDPGPGPRRSWGTVPAWRRQLSAFLKQNPCPDMEELLHLAHLSNAIPDQEMRLAGGEMSRRCLALRKLLLSPGSVDVGTLQQALQWQYHLLRTEQDSPARGATDRSSPKSGRAARPPGGKPSSRGPLDSGPDACRGRRGAGGSAVLAGPPDGEDLPPQSNLDSGFRQVSKVKADSLDSEVRVQRSAALPRNPWLSLPVDELENSAGVTPRGDGGLTEGTTESLRSLDPPTQRQREFQTRHWVLQSQGDPEDPELSSIDHLLSSTMTDGRDATWCSTEEKQTLLWDSYDLHDQNLHHADSVTELMVGGWEAEEQEGLRRLELEELRRVELEELRRVELEELRRVELEELRRVELEELRRVELGDWEREETEGLRRVELRRVELGDWEREETEGLRRVELRRVELGDWEREETEGLRRVELGDWEREETEGLRRVELRRVELGDWEREETEGLRRVELRRVELEELRRVELEELRRVELGDWEREETEGLRRVELRRVELEELRRVELGDWEREETEGLRRVELALGRADQILQEEERVAAQEAVLDALLGSEGGHDGWSGAATQTSSWQPDRSGVVGLEEPIHPGQPDRLDHQQLLEDPAPSSAASGSSGADPLQVHLLDPLTREENLKLSCREEALIGHLREGPTSRGGTEEEEEEEQEVGRCLKDELRREGGAGDSRKAAELLLKDSGGPRDPGGRLDPGGPSDSVDLGEASLQQASEDGSESLAGIRTSVFRSSDVEGLSEDPGPRCSWGAGSAVSPTSQTERLPPQPGPGEASWQQVHRGSGARESVSPGLFQSGENQDQPEDLGDPEPPSTPGMRPDERTFDPGASPLPCPPAPKPRKTLLPGSPDSTGGSDLAQGPGLTKPALQTPRGHALPEVGTGGGTLPEGGTGGATLPEVGTGGGTLPEGGTGGATLPEGGTARHDQQPSPDSAASSASQGVHLPPGLRDGPGSPALRRHPVLGGPSGTPSCGSMRCPAVQDRPSSSRAQVTDFQTPVVLDTGSSLLKAGLADQDLPPVVFPTILGMPKYEEVMDGVERETFIGQEAQHMRGVLVLRHPVKNGVVHCWDDVEKIWQHAFQQLGVDAEDHPVLLSEAAMNPRENRQRTVEIMFECFSVPLCYVAMQAVLALYADGRTTGVVLDSGEGVSHSVPVFEGYCLPHAVQRLPLAGADITAHLKQLLQEQGVSMRTTAEDEIVRDMKETCCYVAPDYEAELKAAAASGAEASYTLPDGRLVTLGTERFRAAEILFRPELIGRDHYGMHESVVKAILASDMDLRRSFLGNIVLSGGTTLLPGMPERLQVEVSNLVLDQKGVRVSSPRNRDRSVWTGGAVLAGLDSFSSAWISQEEYQECGPQVVFRKCF